MLRIIFATTRLPALHTFATALSSDPGVSCDYVDSGTRALEMVRSVTPHLVIIDSNLSDMAPLELVRKLLLVNAMVNTAVISHLPEAEFHEASEGLGVIARLPLEPGAWDAAALLHQLRTVLGGVG
jgi:DNA-binding response OmpR family regulator